ncbi:MAG: hypothetical protein VST70_07080 [Nitrospirota bacterium]|nr:hypothetical protein [Nitrospirota bacterium]
MAFGVNNVTNLDQPVDRVDAGRSSAIERTESRRAEKESRQEVERSRSRDQEAEKEESSRATPERRVDFFA